MIVAKKYSSSLREHPELQEIFSNMESRFPNSEELGAYEALLPEHRDLAKAAYEIVVIERKVPANIIRALYKIYPYEEFHAYAKEKCMRDMSYVLAYATQSMLMNDPQWFEDKLLFWMKTIIQSFRYPDARTPDQFLFDDPEHRNHLKKLAAHQKSIYECYTMMMRELRDNLTGKSFKLIEPYINQAITILSN